MTVDNTNLNQANSFYWTRRAIADATAGSIATDSSGFYTLAQVTHWAQSGQGSIPVPLSTKMPLEGRVWYNYPGQANVDFVTTNASSASTSPSVTARVLDGVGAAPQISYATYNANGLITQSIDPIGRTTNYNYDTNGIDLLTVKQVNGGSQDLLSSMSNYIQHEPLMHRDIGQGHHEENSLLTVGRCCFNCKPSFNPCNPRRSSLQSSGCQLWKSKDCLLERVVPPKACEQPSYSRLHPF